MRLGLDSKVKKKRRRFRTYKKETKRVIVLVSAALIILGMLCATSWALCRVRPIVLEMAENSAGDIAVYIINEAVREEITQRGADYGSLVSFEKDSEGNINAIYTDTLKINELKAGIMRRICDKVKEYDTIEVHVPLGAIFDLELFPGLGPKIKFEMISTGFVDADFLSTFESAGINQTKHQIDVHIEAELGVIGAMGNKAIVVKTGVPVAQSVIVGEVPQEYFPFKTTY